MNAIDILHHDHEKFFPLFDKLDAAETLSKEELNTAFKQLEKIVLEHMRSEEKIFYPALLEIPEIKNMVEKSYQAHHITKVGFVELHLLPYYSDSWKPKFQAIKDSILTHMSEEEEQLFPQLKELIPATKLAEIGQKILDFRK